MAAPPALELEEARLLGVDLRVEVVELAPVGVRRVQAFEVVHQIRAVELAVPEGPQGRRGAGSRRAALPNGASGSCPRPGPSRKSASRRAGSGRRARAR